eukprot:SAG11_NODE_1018_length_6160_cov_2.345818_2_plen_56_part_00
MTAMIAFNWNVPALSALAEIDGMSDANGPLKMPPLTGSNRSVLSDVVANSARMLW